MQNKQILLWDGVFPNVDRAIKNEKIYYFWAKIKNISEGDRKREQNANKTNNEQTGIAQRI